MRYVETMRLIPCDRPEINSEYVPGEDYYISYLIMKQTKTFGNALLY
jgi:hypothetical protein